MKDIILFIFIFLNYQLLFGQQETIKEGKHHKDSINCPRHGVYHPIKWFWDRTIIIKTGYTYSRYHSGEIGIGYLKLIGDSHDPYGSKSITIGNEFIFDKKIIYGPKVTAEASYMIFGTRLNATYNTLDFNYGSLKIRPEIGLTLLGFLNVFYGYTFNVTNRDFYNQKHTISIYGNIPTIKFFFWKKTK